MEINKDKNLILDKLIMLSKASEQKYKEGNFKGAIEDKRRVKKILNEENLEKEIIEKYKKEISLLYISKFDLINDHKARINSSRRIEIIHLLEKKSEEKYNQGDYKGAIKALRRSEKYS
tara:strand:- start:10018 stop:10374 length:357 start_codon:yes stop_codon:yes gene_type:complete